MPTKKTKRQVRKTSGAAQPAVSPVVSGNGARTTDGGFNPDYGYVISDLRRIGVLAGIFFVALVLLAFIVPLLLR
jgi:hypothetical protein